MNTHLKQLFIGGTITGFFTGLLVGIASSGDELSGSEAIFAFLVLPGLIAALLTLLSQKLHLLSGKWLLGRLTLVAYTTTFPIFGFAAGGANIALLSLVGAFFGTLWGILIMLCGASKAK